MTSSEIPKETKLPPGVRVALATVAIVGLSLLAVARMLEPDTRGHGTHEQLGLTPCFFQQRFGMVCPSCGTTTAWAYLTRGQVRQALAANGAGTLLALLVVVAAPWLMVSSALGRWWPVEPTLILVLTVGTGLLAVAVLDWLRKCFFA